MNMNHKGSDVLVVLINLGFIGAFVSIVIGCLICKAKESLGKMIGKRKSGTNVVLLALLLLGIATTTVYAADPGTTVTHAEIMEALARTRGSVVYGVITVLVVMLICLFVIIGSLGATLDEIKSKLGGGTNAILLALLLLSVTTTTVRASNPADVTAEYRTCPIFYSKVAYDAGPWYFLQIAPLGDKSSISYCHWEDELGQAVEDQIVLSRRISCNLDVAVDVEKWQGSDSCTDLMVDIHKGPLGVGVRVPLLDSGEARVGPRVKFGSFTAYYAAALETHNKLYGVSYCKKNLQIDLASDCQSITYLRASYWRGDVVPELRLKFANKETFIGFALAYYPH